MIVHADSQPFKALAEGLGAGLAVILRDADGADQQAAAAKLVAQAQHVVVVGDAKVGTHLVLLDVAGTDGDDNLGVVAQLHQHLQLTIWFKTRQYATGVIVVEQLAAKFKIELVAELRDAFLDVFGLDFEILFVVETVFHKKQILTLEAAPRHASKEMVIIK